MLSNDYIDITAQKGGIPGVSGCIEHTSVLTQIIKEAKENKTQFPLEVCLRRTANTKQSLCLGDARRSSLCTLWSSGKPGTRSFMLSGISNRWKIHLAP